MSLFNTDQLIETKVTNIFRRFREEFFEVSLPRSSKNVFRISVVGEQQQKNLINLLLMRTTSATERCKAQQNR